MSPILADIVVVTLLLVIVAVVLTMLAHLWLRVPYVPTSMNVVRGMIDAAKLKGDETVYDLGAGDGRLLIEAKRRYPGLIAIGCELVPTIWLLGKIRILLSGQTIRWKCADAFKEDVSDADVLFLYLTPNLLGKLRPNLEKQLRPGALVVSHGFRFQGREPVRVHEFPSWSGRARVWVYKW